MSVIQSGTIDTVKLSGSISMGTIYSGQATNAYTTMPSNYYYAQPPYYIAGISEIKEEAMKSLYKIYLVVNEDEGLAFDECAIASTEEEAKFKAGVYDFLRDHDIELDEVTIFVQKIGSLNIKK